MFKLQKYQRVKFNRFCSKLQNCSICTANKNIWIKFYRSINIENIENGKILNYVKLLKNYLKKMKISVGWR